MWVVYCDQPAAGATARRRTYFGGPRWWTANRQLAARWLDEGTARYVMESFAFNQRRSTVYLYGVEQVDDPAGAQGDDCVGAAGG